MGFTHPDRLYGPVAYSQGDLRLYQTKLLSRLRQVSLSAVPTWLMRAGTCASKFEHSVGAAHLARVLAAAQPELEEVLRDVYFALLAHDLGTPPFSHLSEHFMRRMLGKDHEQYGAETVDGSEFAREVRRQGGSVDRMIRLMLGTEPPTSDLVNGSIDMDNLDNTLRYGTSLGLVRGQPYSPERLAGAYRLNGDSLTLQQGCLRQIEGWERCRRQVYSYIYSDENLVPGMMVFRALDLASAGGLVPDHYFRMTDAQAYEFLERQCGTAPGRLMRRARLWQFYGVAFAYDSATPTEGLSALVNNLYGRTILAGEISALLGAEPEDVCVFIGRNKGFKQIHLPLLADSGECAQHEGSILGQSWTARVCLYGRIATPLAIGRVGEFMESRLGVGAGCPTL